MISVSFIEGLLAAMTDFTKAGSFITYILVGVYLEVE